MMDEQRVEVYFDSLRPDYPEYLNALEKEALRTEVPIIRRATRDVLRYLLKTKKPARVLEVGTAIGYSALFMQALSAGDIQDHNDRKSRKCVLSRQGKIWKGMTRPVRLN